MEGGGLTVFIMKRGTKSQGYDSIQGRMTAALVDSMPYTHATVVSFGSPKEL